MLNIQTLVLGELATNCYLITNENGETIIIDPADEGTFISETILQQKLKPVAIILTHGHFDHVLGCLELKLNFNLPIYIHPKDQFLLKQAQKSARHWLGHSVDPVPLADHFLEDKQIIFDLEVIHTPGHTPGSICLYHTPRHSERSEESLIFTGDTLFSNGTGATHHSYSSAPDLQKSINILNSKFLTLNSDITIFPGHGETFNLQERKII